MGGNDDVFGGSEHNQVYVIISLITSIIGTLASSIIIILIFRMRSKTSHVYLVLVMSLYQLMYDVSFFFSAVSVSYYATVVANVFQLIGGIGNSLISNWIAFIAMHIVCYRQKVDIFGNLYVIHISCFIFGFLSALVYFIATVPQSRNNPELVIVSIVYIYNNIRLLSILLNFLFVMLIAAKIYRTSSLTVTSQEIAIRTLSRRMIYYPVLQAIGRSGYTWYEYAYGDTLNADDAGQVEYSSMIFASIITPMVSVGYLLIFLVMQPNAYKEFKRFVYCQPSISSSTTNERQSSKSRNNSLGSSTASRKTEVRFDSEFAPDFNNSIYRNSASNPSTTNTQTMVTRNSVIDWMRRSYQPSMYYRETEVDVRDEEELYEIMDNNNHHNNNDNNGVSNQQHRESWIFNNLSMFQAPSIAFNNTVNNHPNSATISNRSSSQHHSNNNMRTINAQSRGRQSSLPKNLSDDDNDIYRDSSDNIHGDGNNYDNGSDGIYENDSMSLAPSMTYQDSTSCCVVEMQNFESHSANNSNHDGTAVENILHQNQ